MSVQLYQIKRYPISLADKAQSRSQRQCIFGQLTEHSDESEAKLSIIFRVCDLFGQHEVFWCSQRMVLAKMQPCADATIILCLWTVLPSSLWAKLWVQQRNSVYSGKFTEEAFQGKNNNWDQVTKGHKTRDLPLSHKQAEPYYRSFHLPFLSFSIQESRIERSLSVSLSDSSPLRRRVHVNRTSPDSWPPQMRARGW